MEIERCRRAGDDWHLKLRHRGQLMFVALARAEIDALIEGENPSEAHVVDALREHEGALGRAIDGVVANKEVPREFASLRMVSDWE